MSKTYSILDYGAISGGTDCTCAIQSAIDACFTDGGGVVEIPAGEYHTGDIRLRSHVTLHLLKDALLIGSRDPMAYYHYRDDKLEPLPEEWITEALYTRGKRLTTPEFMAKPGSRWVHGLIKAMGAEDIAVIGEEGSIIDGQDCYDELGEENYRGPHAISLYYCRNIRFSGYTIQSSANWAHAIFNSENIHMDHVTVYAGHDGIHYTSCRNMTVEDCAFYTGDDCIAGIDLINVTVRRCILNTACSAFRMGGTNVLVENCRMYGPAAYLFRGSMTKEEKAACMPSLANPGGVLRDDAGHRFNMLSAYTYYADYTREISVQPGNILLKDCVIENADRLLHYNYSGNETWQINKPLRNIRMEGIRASGISLPLNAYGDSEIPLHLEIADSDITFREDREAAFMHLCHYDYVLLENVKIRIPGDKPLIRIWSEEGEIRLKNVDAPNQRVEKSEEPFFAQPI
ncbi:MAG: right-handed parallel beta-helix repeat-containing protein [Clostridia bacterium]|nr:right-handed parallel beta-helix repeat-containing protein [Clostridia bacterium]